MPAGAVPHRAAEPYQLFLKSSLIVAVTAGWLLGTVELVAITFHGAFQQFASAVIRPALFQVHGQSQIVGWVGLFIMGVAYQVIPRQRRVALHTPVLAYCVLGLMLAGIALRAVAQPLAAGSAGFGWAMVLSAILELAGLTLFVGGLVRGRVMADSIQGPERFSRAALVWFWLALLLNLATTVHMALTGSNVAPDWLDVPLVVLELFGFITAMIFGVNARNVPLFMPVRPVKSEALATPMRLLMASMLVTALGEGLAAEVKWGRAMAGAGWVALLAAALLFIWRVGLLQHERRVLVVAGRSRWYEAYVRAAYFWLVVGVGMEAAASLAASFAGAARNQDLFLAGLHAITVGFISTMIMGMAARIVPAFAGTQLYSRGLLIATWIAITAGSALRVFSQATYTSLSSISGPVLGVSGIIQLAALILFAVNLWETLSGRHDSGQTNIGAEQTQAPGRRALAH